MIDERGEKLQKYKNHNIPTVTINCKNNDIWHDKLENTRQTYDKINSKPSKSTQILYTPMHR